MKISIKKLFVAIMAASFSYVMGIPQASSAKPIPAPRSPVSLAGKSTEPVYASIAPQSFQKPVPRQQFSIKNDADETRSNVVLSKKNENKSEVIYADPKSLQFGSRKAPTPPPVPDRTKKPKLVIEPGPDKSNSSMITSRGKPQSTPSPVIRSNKPVHSNNIPNVKEEPRMMSRAEIQKVLQQPKASNQSSNPKAFEQQQNDLFYERRKRIEAQIPDPEERKKALEALDAEYKDIAKNATTVQPEEPIYSTVKK